jgi:hypothetical protein
MVDSLLDWMSPPGLHRLNACPESDDNKPPHAALTSVDDLKKVCGWAEFTSKPGWDEDFTISNCGGVLDLGWASRDMLRALVQSLGIGGDDRVDQFLQLRQGSDGIDGTADDFQFSSAVGETTQRGVLPDHYRQRFKRRLVSTSNNCSRFKLKRKPRFKNTLVFRVTREGKSGDVTRTFR